MPPETASDGVNIKIQDGTPLTTRQGTGLPKVDSDIRLSEILPANWIGVSGDRYFTTEVQSSKNGRDARVQVVQYVPIVQDFKDIRNRFERLEPAAS